MTAAIPEATYACRDRSICLDGDIGEILHALKVNILRGKVRNVFPFWKDVL